VLVRDLEGREQSGPGAVLRHPGRPTTLASVPAAGSPWDRASCAREAKGPVRHVAALPSGTPQSKVDAVAGLVHLEGSALGGGQTDGAAGGSPEVGRSAARRPLYQQRSPFLFGRVPTIHCTRSRISGKRSEPIRE
jgi:hypothetical protein